MTGNYLKVAYRNMLKHKGQSFINIIGLAIGIAVCLLLFLWVQDEFSFDRYHTNARHIYRMIFQRHQKGVVKYSPNTPAPLGAAMVQEFPEVLKAVRMSRQQAFVRLNEKQFSEKIFLTDPEIFDIFSISLLKGDVANVLREPATVLLSEDMSKKYFGLENPLGKTINLYKKYDFKVTGVFKNIPANSHIRFDILIPMLHYRKDYVSNWGISNCITYVLTTGNFRPDSSFTDKMYRFAGKYRGEKVRDFYKMNYLPQPLTDIYFGSWVKDRYSKNRDPVTVYIFAAIAVFILFIACLNYINLANMRFTSRTKEIAIRKILGAGPGQLTKQNLWESCLFALLALPLALLAGELFLPTFNSFAGKFLAINYFSNIPLMLGLITTLIIVGVISGIIPGLFVSIAQPADLLKGRARAGPFILIMRRVLVIFQFFVSLVLIISTMVMYNQYRFMGTKDLGIKKEHVVSVHMNHNKEARLKQETLKHNFLRHPGVELVSICDFTAGRPYWNNNYWLKGMSSNEYRMIGSIPVDYDFFDTLEVMFVEGRGFSKEYATDKDSAFIINEAALQRFGWKTGTGKYFNVGNWKKGFVVGVVKDFHFKSLRSKIEPLVFYIEPTNNNYFLVRIDPGKTTQALAHLKKTWQQHVPDQPFHFTFLDEDISHLYRSEKRLLEILFTAAILAVFIACLGLLGLTAYATEKRVKEIGIRKTFGASLTDILVLLNKEFSFLVLVAALFAWPTAWYITDTWLKQFAYRHSISILTFVFALLLTLVVTLSVTSYKTIKAAAANPVESLRYE